MPELQEALDEYTCGVGKAKASPNASKYYSTAQAHVLFAAQSLAAENGWSMDQGLDAVLHALAKLRDRV